MVFVPPATSRDLVGAVRDLVVARRMFRERALRAGDQHRVPASPWRSSCRPPPPGCRAAYIESATRTRRAVADRAARRPGAARPALHAVSGLGRRRRGASAGPSSTPSRPRPCTQPPPVRKVVVTLGTHERYTFPRLLQPPRDAPAAGLGGPVAGRCRPLSTGCPPAPAGRCRCAEMRQALAEADVVISHAGVGSALAAMQAGKRALYVPAAQGVTASTSTTTRSRWPGSWRAGSWSWPARRRKSPSPTWTLPQPGRRPVRVTPFRWLVLNAVTNAARTVDGHPVPSQRLLPFSSVRRARVPTRRLRPRSLARFLVPAAVMSLTVALTAIPASAVYVPPTDGRDPGLGQPGGQHAARPERQHARLRADRQHGLRGRLVHRRQGGRRQRAGRRRTT